MQIKKTHLAILGIILLSFVIGVYFYPQLPDKIASHWNAADQVNGYMDKFLGIFLMPIMSIFLFGLFLLIPKIDPLKKNIEKFRKHYDGLVLGIIVFLLYIHVLVLLWNIGIQYKMSQAILPALGILFIYIGSILPHMKRNWFMGIRTPWTISSDNVWQKTHAIGGKLFKASGIIAFAGLLLPDYSIALILFPVLASALYLVVFSYFEYQKESKK